MNEIQQGTVTISLRDYHELRKAEETLNDFLKKPDCVLICFPGDFYSERWAVVRPDEALTRINETFDLKIKQLEERYENLTQAQRKPKLERMLKW